MNGGGCGGVIQRIKISHHNPSLASCNTLKVLRSRVDVIRSSKQAIQKRTNAIQNNKKKTVTQMLTYLLQASEAVGR